MCLLKLSMKRKKMTEQFDIRQMPILTLDDQPLNTELVNSILSVNGFTNHRSLNEPLDLMDVLKESPVDLLLLDLNMPIMDGFSVLEMLDTQYGKLDKPVVIMLTAQGDKESRICSFEAGASDYVTKPFDQVELIKRIEIQLEKRALTKQLIKQNNNLEELVQQRTNDMREAYQEILARLGRAAEYRDNETGNHIKRVSFFAELMALDMGLGATYADLLRIATPMHDVGKIGISDTIMLKPGKLTFEEFEIMKTHVVIGAEILGGHPSEFLQLAHDVALTHHEKFDGSGYPNGTKGEDIPICGRIVAIADVFDALMSERPYKKEWALQDAIDLIVSEKGKHFDPALVDCFLRVLPDMLVIKEKFADKFDH